MSFVALTALAAVVCGFLSPDFGLSATGLVLFVGIFVALIVMAVVFSLPADIGIRRQIGEWGKVNFPPGTVLVSVVLVLLSRLLGFQPGCFYGALAGLAFRSALSVQVQGRMTAANWLFSLVVSVGVGGRPGVQHLVDRAGDLPGHDLPVGRRGLGRAVLPMRFLDGRKVLR